MKGKYARKRIAEIRKRQIRIDLGTEDELRSLARSWLATPIHPIICRSNLDTADGNRRIHGLGLLIAAGELPPNAEIDVFITDEELTDARMDEIALLSAVHRKGLSDYERAQAIRRLADAHPDWSRKQLAEHLNIDPSMVTRLLPAKETIPPVEDAFKEGRIGISDRYNISLVPLAEQAAQLAGKLAGASRDTVAREGRRRRNGPGSAPHARTSRVKCQLTGGASVVVSGEEMSLDDMIEALAEAHKEAKKARDQGLDVKTFQAVMRDKAKAG